jgi:UDP-N-acetylmuramate--alanine ligase
MLLSAANMVYFKIGLIHMVGIGGIGMSGIAEILLNLGYKVQGSDIKESYIAERLEKLGIKVFYGHNKENIKDAKLLVVSSAIDEKNPEVCEAVKLGIPVIKRAEILAEIMRLKISIAISGTHGKTTTSALVGAMLEAADLKPTVINGGIINNKSTNAYLGEGDFLIAEADESDGTFIKVPSCIAVITNIDPEHLDFYGNFEGVKKAFYKFIENLPFYGFGVLCKDHPEVEKLIKEITNRKIITYGIDSQEVDIKAVNIRNKNGHFLFDVKVGEKIDYPIKEIKDIYLPVYGIHNVLNSLAAVAIAVQFNMNSEIIKAGFKNFTGVKRRFTKTGEVKGINIIDDYAHHPAEIKATLKAAKSIAQKKVIAIFQPHRYSRLQSLFSEFTHSFEDADILIVTEIFSAGELPLDGINDKILVAAIEKAKKAPKVYNAKLDDELVKLIEELAEEGDYIICLGAGNITYFANKLPTQLENLLKDKI